MRRKIDTKQKELIDQKLRQLYRVLSGLTAALKKDEINHQNYYKYSAISKQLDELYQSGFKYKKEC